jgi:ankyrin repeat protein
VKGMTCYFKNAFDCDGAGDQIGDRVLLDAVKRGNVEDVRFALDGGGLTILELTDGKNWRPQQCFDGRTALQVAVHAEKADVVQLLLQCGASTSTTDSYGLKPLHGAAAYQRGGEIITFLLDHGADIDAPSTDGATKYHRNGWCEMLESSTPLMVACWWGYKEVVKALVDRGANLAARNKQGLTAMEIADRRRNHGVLEFLVEIGGGPPLLKRSVVQVVDPACNEGDGIISEGDDDEDEDEEDDDSDSDNTSS